MQQKKLVNEKILELTNSHTTTSLVEFGKINERMEKIIDRLKYPSYGERKFFVSRRIGKIVLDKLCKYDLALIKKIEISTEQVQELRDKKGVIKIKKEIKNLLDILTDIDSHLDIRKEILLEVK